jgi:hypothetical protein
MERVSQRKVTRKVNDSKDADYHKVDSISFIDNSMILKVDGKEYKFKLKNISQRLYKASKKEREAFRVISSGYGINWPLIDEDLSIDGLIRTYKKLTS